MKKVLLALLVFVLSILSFSATENLAIKKIEILNNREVPFEVIQSNIKMKEGDFFSTEMMLDDFKRLKQVEYFDDVVIQPEAYNGGIKVMVNVFEKPNVVELLEAKGIVSLSDRRDIDKSLIVSSVKISGNKRFETKEILSIINIKPGEYFSKNKIIDAQRKLISTGYFKEVIPNITENRGRLNVSFHVVENQIINDIVITGSTIFSPEDLKSALSTKPGQIENYNLIKEDADKILSAYHQAGYSLVNISELGVDDTGTLRISIVEGIIRKIEVRKMITKQKGNRRKPNDDVLKTQTYVIDREVELEPGKIFNEKDYQATVDNLMRLGIFKNVKYEARAIPGDPQGVNLVLLIDEDRTAVLQGALSYGSEVGLMGTLSLKDNNWKGKGQEFGFSFEKSNRNYTGFNVDFFDPWIRGTDRVSWGWGAYKTSYGDGTSSLFNSTETLGLRANIGKGLSRNLRLSIGAKIEKLEEKHSGPYKQDPATKKWYYTGKRNPVQIDGVDDKYYIWSIYPYISYDTRNNYLNATSGTYAKLQVEGGYASGYKADYFGNITLDARKYHKGFFKKNTFAYRVVGGIMTESTKETQRFWVGGGSSLRGYDGGFFKGTQKLVGTIENRTQINDILGLVVFADAGRAWNQKGRDPEYIRENKKFGSNIATTAGVGVRLNTPIGPLRFDFGWPVGNKMSKDGMQFYFNMGQAF